MGNIDKNEGEGIPKQFLNSIGGWGAFDFLSFIHSLL
jgi:hypothetical protein